MQTHFKLIIFVRKPYIKKNYNIKMLSKSYTNKVLMASMDLSRLSKSDIGLFK